MQFSISGLFFLVGMGVVLGVHETILKFIYSNNYLRMTKRSLKERFGELPLQNNETPIILYNIHVCVCIIYYITL